MNYCIVENGVIVNIIVCEDENVAAVFGAVPAYDTAVIGETYDASKVPEPVEPEPTEPEPTQLDILEAQVTYTAMMTDTLLEV